MKNQLTVLGVPILMGFMLTSLASAGNIGPNANGGGIAGTLPPACGFGGTPAYCNGPINGNTDAWTINFGFAVSDSFTLGASAILTSAEIAVWETPGDTGTSVGWSISATPFGGSVAAASVTDTFLGLNSYGYNIDNWTFSLGGGGVNLSAGTYWLTLQNASVPSGDPVYWDENNGPSMAKENTIGSIPSESFALYGECCAPPVPEPGTLVLCGSGLVLLAGALRGTLKRAARGVTYSS